MTNHSRMLVCFGAASAITATAGDPMLNPNRFSLGPRLTLNLRSEFTSAVPRSNVGALAASGATAVDRSYDDGFVNIDTSGNAGGMTWFWGYEAASQVAGVGTPGASLTFNSAASPANGTMRRSEDEPAMGISFSYDRVMRSWPTRDGGWGSWGLSFGFDHTWLRQRDEGRVAGLVPLTTDTYLIGAGVVPPAPPFSGTFGGPGILIPDTPTGGRTVDVPTAATSAVKNQVDGNVYAVSAGGFMEHPFHERLIGSVSARAIAAVADRTYSFSETRAVTGVATQFSSGSIRSTDWLFGVAVDARFTVPINDRFAGYFGVGWQNIGTTSQSVGGKTAKLNFDAAFNVNAGLNWQF